MNRTFINRVWLSDEAVFIELKDGKRAFERFADYHRLESATPEQRERYTVSYFGIHWPELDEDLSFDGFFRKSDNGIISPQEI